MKEQITWLEVSRSAIIHNIHQFKKNFRPETEFLAVVKGNGYGHGLIETAKTTVRGGANWLGTVNLQEALELRKAGIKSKILVLSYFNPAELKDAIINNIALTIYYLPAATKISELAKKINKKAQIHIKIDTGTNRLGFDYRNCLSTIIKINQLPNIVIQGIFTHFADAEKTDQSFTNLQIERFGNLYNQLKKNHIHIKYQHAACSAAAILNKNSHYNLIRIGISLYGLWSLDEKTTKSISLKKSYQLKPALSWYTRVIQVKKVPAGDTIGYGKTFTTKKNSTIAVIPVGYNEGYDRRLSNQGRVAIHGRYCQIRGRVCANLTMVDVTDVKKVRPGDKVTLIGRDGQAEITAEELAEKMRTINYEVVTRINPNLPRVFIN